MLREDEFLLFGILAEEQWLRHAFTTRRFAERAGAPESRGQMVGRLRDRLFPEARSTVWGEQVHGHTVVLACGGGVSPAEMPGADALIVGEGGVLLAAFGADCPVVFIADRRARAIGLVHSGRKGTEARVVTACLDEMGKAFGTSPSDCACAISPSIGPCCYPVDLWSSLEEELRAAGIARVENPRACTSCRPALFFSYRKERERSGRMVGAMMIMPADDARPGLTHRAGQNGVAATLLPVPDPSLIRLTSPAAVCYTMR